MAVLGHTDAIVFTGGIGENNSRVRFESLKCLEQLGISIDEKANVDAVSGAETLITKADSQVKVYVIPTNEELQIALDTFALA